MLEWRQRSDGKIDLEIYFGELHMKIMKKRCIKPEDGRLIQLTLAVRIDISDTTVYENQIITEL